MNDHDPIQVFDPSRRGDCAASRAGSDGPANRKDTHIGGFLARNTRRIRGFFDIYGERTKAEWLELNQ